jgi:hypothetical protein
MEVVPRRFNYSPPGLGLGSPSLSHRRVIVIVVYLSPCRPIASPSPAVKNMFLARADARHEPSRSGARGLVCLRMETVGGAEPENRPDLSSVVGVGGRAARRETQRSDHHTRTTRDVASESAAGRVGDDPTWSPSSGHRFEP